MLTGVKENGWITLLSITLSFRACLIFSCWWMVREDKISHHEEV